MKYSKIYKYAIRVQSIYVTNVAKYFILIHLRFRINLKSFMDTSVWHYLIQHCSAPTVDESGKGRKRTRILFFLSMFFPKIQHTN